VPTEVDELSVRVAILKERFAKQKVSVKLEHEGELAYVRTRFTEFRRRVQELQEADDTELARFEEVRAVETLLSALS